MSTYREGDSVSIHGCNYKVTENYLSAKSNGSYPKVLAKILGITDINRFVNSVLGYSGYAGKKFGYANMADCAKLINALQNYQGVDTAESDILSDRIVNNYFSNETNLEELTHLTKGIKEVLNNFNNIKNASTNVIAKVRAKNKELVEAVDSRNVDRIKAIKAEFNSIAEYITESSTVLARLNEIWETLNVETEDFNAEEFING